MSGPQERGEGRWWWALLALPVVCCAGSGVLAALGVGSIGAVLGGLTGSILLGVLGLLVLIVTVTVAGTGKQRRSRR
jgi:hypothetical protein